MNLRKGGGNNPSPSACQKSLFDKLVDGGASFPARCRVKIFDFAVGSFAFGET